MAQPTNTFDTFDSIGNREDLSEEIYMLATDETPLMSAIGTKKATSTLHEWQTDDLGSASASNAHVQGDDFAGDAVAPTARKTNRTQISKQEIVITGTQEVVDKAGRASEMAYQKAKKLRKQKMDIEAALCANNAAVAGDSSTASELGGIEAWLETNTDRGAGGADGGDGTTAATDGTQRAFTEGLLTTVLQSVYENGGNPDCIIAGAKNRVAISGFAGTGQTRFVNSEAGKLHTSVEVYVSDFGELKVMPSRYVRTRSALVLDTDHLAVAYLRPTFSEPVSKTGDSIKEHIITEYTLEVGNEKSCGIVADLTV